MNPQDPAAERAELLAAGVPERRVYALYPANFSAIVPGLQAHLGVVKVDSLLRQQKALGIERVALLQLASQVKVQRSRADQIVEKAEVELLAHTLHQNLGGVAVEGANTIAATCATMLWHLYALLPLRHALNLEQRAQLDSSACWFGIYLLKLDLDARINAQLGKG